MTMMVDKSNTVDGVPTSLLDLGYSDVGLDDVSRIVIAPYLLRCCPPPLTLTITQNLHWKLRIGNCAANMVLKATAFILRRADPSSILSASPTFKT